jgi:hypothetical protein
MALLQGRNKRGGAERSALRHPGLVRAADQRLADRLLINAQECPLSGVTGTYSENAAASPIDPHAT